MRVTVCSHDDLQGLEYEYEVNYELWVWDYETMSMSYETFVDLEVSRFFFYMARSFFAYHISISKSVVH